MAHGRGRWFEYSTTFVPPGQTRARLINAFGAVIWPRPRTVLARASIIDWGAQSRETQERAVQGHALYAKLPVELRPPQKLQ